MFPFFRSSSPSIRKVRQIDFSLLKIQIPFAMTSRNNTTSFVSTEATSFYVLPPKRLQLFNRYSFICERKFGKIQQLIYLLAICGLFGPYYCLYFNIWRGIRKERIFTNTLTVTTMLVFVDIRVVQVETSSAR